MDLKSLCEQSTRLAIQLNELVALPLFDDSTRVRTSDVACSMSLEHWEAVRGLIATELFPSAVVVQRAQFEALVRTIWILYAASDGHIQKLSSTLNIETEQAAKNLPQLNDMMQELSHKAPPPAYDALLRFKNNSWKALNSYAHAGIHPLRRHEEGYPVVLLEDVLRNSNGLGVISCMQAVILSGCPTMQKQILELASNYQRCLPPPF